MTALALAPGTRISCEPAAATGVDRAIRVSTAIAVLAVAGVAAYELVFGGFQRGGEAGPVRVGARAGLHGVHHGHAQQLVEGEQGPGLLLQAGPVA